METDLTNTDVFKTLGTPHLPPGPLMVAEAAASAQMLEADRTFTRCPDCGGVTMCICAELRELDREEAARG